MVWKLAIVLLSLIPLFDGQTTSVFQRRTSPPGGVQSTRFNGGGGVTTPNIGGRQTQPPFQTNPPNGQPSTPLPFPTQQQTRQPFFRSTDINSGQRTFPPRSQSTLLVPQNTGVNGQTNPPQVGSTRFNNQGPQQTDLAATNTPRFQPGGGTIFTSAFRPGGATSPRGQPASRVPPGSQATTPTFAPGGTTGRLNNQPGGQTNPPGRQTNPPGGSRTTFFNRGTKRAFPTAGIQGVFKPQISDSSSAISPVGSIIVSLLSMFFALVVIS